MSHSQGRKGYGPYASFLKRQPRNQRALWKQQLHAIRQLGEPIRCLAASGEGIYKVCPLPPKSLPSPKRPLSPLPSAAWQPWPQTPSGRNLPAWMT